QRRRAAYARPTHSPSDSRWGQHASLWKKLESSGNHGSYLVSRDPTSRGPSPCPRCRPRHSASEEWHAPLGSHHAVHTSQHFVNVVGFRRDHPCCPGFLILYIWTRLASSV